MSNKTAIDPVCAMTVDTTNAKFSSVHNNKTYYFCSAGCKATFDKDPQQFADAGVKGGSR